MKDIISYHPVFFSVNKILPSTVFFTYRSNSNWFDNPTMGNFYLNED